ncbi:MAG: glycosyltransferase family 39 protein [Acidobacteriota bacterium]
MAFLATDRFQRIVQALSPVRLRSLVLIFAGAAAIKLLILAVDHTLAFHSDSGSYLQDAVTLRASWPRPLGYGLFIRLVFLLTGGVHIKALMLFQSLTGALLAPIVYFVGRRFLTAGPRLALVAALLVTLSPGNLVIERFMLSDAVTSTVLALSLVGLLLYLERPSARRGLVLGIAAVLPLLFRAIWAYLPALYLVMAALLLLRREGRRQALRGLVTATVVTVCVYLGYSAVFSRSSTGEVDLGAGTSGFSGWVLWGSVARFAEAGDLEGFAGGDVLLSDLESLQRNGSYQIWDFTSTAHQLREQRYGGSFVDTNKALLHASWRILCRHPLQFGLQFLQAVGRFFTGEPGNADLSRPVEIDPSVGRDFATYGGIDFSTLPQRPPEVGPAYRAWRGSRWLFVSALFVGLPITLWRPYRRRMLLALSLVGISYLLVVNVAIGFIFVERYFLPVEYIGTLILMGSLAALWRRRPRAHRQSAARNENVSD